MIYERINIPDHTDELQNIHAFLLKIKKDYNNKLNRDQLDIVLIKKYVYLLEKTLELIGELSDHIYDLKSELDDIYTLKYSNSPIMGQNLFNKHYYDLHKPYDKLKNMAWQLLFEINRVEM